MASSRQAIVVAFVGLSLGGCGTSSEPASPTPPPTKGFCATDTTADTFVVGVHHQGDAGYDVAIMSASPTPPEQGENRWTLLVKNPAGDPVSNAVIGIRCSMPGHGHDCAVTPKVTPSGDGHYEITSLYLNMPKHWDVAVTVTDGTATDEVTFGLCVE